MNVDPAIAAMRQRSANLDIERARLAGVMRSIFMLAGVDGLRAMTAAEMEKITQNANDNNRDWIG